VLLSLFAALGAALWWLFREGESSPAPSSLSRERSLIVQSLLALEAEAAGEALEAESLSSLKKKSS
jgi:hypothetical protein